MEKVENWKPIPGWAEYEASSLGRIRSVDRYQKHSRTGNSYLKRGVVRRQQTVSGYKYIRLCSGGKCSTKKVHRLVCSAFFGDEIGLEVNHKDGNKTNNNLSNLEWCTRSKNIQHAFETGLRSMKGEKNSRAILTKRKVEMILMLLEAEFTGIEISKVFSVHESTIAAIKSGRNWHE